MRLRLKCIAAELTFRRGMVSACLNINSLIAHIDELRIFISCIKIDVLHV